MRMEIPTKWAMYTPKGDERLTTLAKRAADKVEALGSAGKMTHTGAQKVCVDFIAAWVKMERYKSYGEASDTEVRECVADFHDRLYTRATGRGDSQAWERHRHMEWEGRRK
jgi:hypothetical protein